VFVVAGDLTPMEHLESLAIVAKNTSLSVSKTINLHSNVTKEEISEVYLKAYEMGVIGVTVYRDGCRDGILVHQVDENKNDIIVKTNAPKRPKAIPCHVYRVNIFNKITNLSEKWIIFVGLLNDDPYEIIAGKINGHDFDSSISDGELLKTKLDGKKVYQFIHNGAVICEDIQLAFMNEHREYATRLMSLALRHGAGVEHLQTVLRKSGTIVDFNQAIVKAISRYIKDVKSKEKCPVCNSELRYTEGCVKCANMECSFTKCG
jgi:ribonucleoside-diphosphate reductase alpha chain